jgi:hypothetical protein
MKSEHTSTPTEPSNFENTIRKLIRAGEEDSGRRRRRRTIEGPRAPAVKPGRITQA